MSKSPANVIYQAPFLSFYDIIVHGISNRWIWKVPTQRLVQLYDQHITSQHLEIGVGTGFLLDKCKFPNDHPRVTLLDLNQGTLRVTGRRLRRYMPAPCCANVLSPMPICHEQFDSVGLSYVLHCLPGTMLQKSIVLEQLTPLLRNGGVLFGATLLGSGVSRNAAARRLMAFYNRAGVFCNEDDSADALESILSNSFPRYHMTIHGCAAIFVGYTNPQ